MSIDKYDWMESQWGFRNAPIRQDAMNNPTDPFSKGASAREIEEFGKTFIAGSVRGGLTYGYLWSAAHERFQTQDPGVGYGKTALLRYMERRINEDFGAAVGRELGMRPSGMVAAYTSLNNGDARGLFALLFSAVERWTDPSQSKGPNGESILGAARARIVDKLACEPDDAEAIAAEVERVRRALPGGATLPPLRNEVIEHFSGTDEGALLEELGGISAMSRSRNGLAFFESAVACLTAAGVEHVFFFLDQLEYMVTTGAFNTTKKKSEVARFRTVFTEHAALTRRSHVVFTLHDNAAKALEPFWAANRLPSFERDQQGNKNSIVVLRGLESADKIADLVLPYFNDARPGHALLNTITPLDASTFPAIWEEDKARPGFILRHVAAALDLAAEENRPMVDMDVVSRVLNIDLDLDLAAEPEVDASDLIE
jgi:hypothetical protein